MANNKSKKETIQLDLMVTEEQEVVVIHRNGKKEEVHPDPLLDLQLKQSLKTFVLAGMDAIFCEPYPFDQDKLDTLLASFRYLKGMDPHLNRTEILATYKTLLLEACQNGKIEEISKAYDEYVRTHSKAISQELRDFHLDLRESPYNGFLFVKMKLSAAYRLSKEMLKTLLDESLLAKKKEENVVWMFEVPIGLTVLNELNKVPKLFYAVEGNNDMVFFERK